MRRVLKLTPTVSFLLSRKQVAISQIPNLRKTSLTTSPCAQPPANSFVPREKLDNAEPEFPLEVNFCSHCAHLQLAHVVSPDALFRHYVYVSGTSPVMVEHLKSYALRAVNLCDLSTGDFVFEFGSNDGTLLRHFKDLGFTVLGMDPAINLATAATANGLPTIPEFFNGASAVKVRSEYGRANVICANHCCAHIDDFSGVVEGVKELLADDGVWIFEVGYLYHVFQGSLFDTIYHEHVDFHSVEPLRKFCSENGLQLLHAESNSIQGGSLRCYVGWAESKVEITGGAQSVSDLIREEAAVGLHLESTFLNWVSSLLLTSPLRSQCHLPSIPRHLILFCYFVSLSLLRLLTIITLPTSCQADSIANTRVEIVALLHGLRAAGKTIAAYGAPAKATTLMYHFNLTSDVIKYIIDDNPLKQGLFSPPHQPENL